MSWQWYAEPEISQEELWSPGDVVSDGKRVKVVRFHLDGRVYYRKESRGERFGRLLDRVARGGGGCSMPEQEARNLEQLAYDGFLVVPVIAAGSFFCAGMPLQGVMVTAVVDAPLLESVLGLQVELWRKYGGLVGSLHDHGYYDDCRAKDVLLDGDKLVLLDREKHRSGGGWNCRKAVKSLLRTTYRNQRSGVKADSQSLEAFWQGYAEGADVKKEQLQLLRQQVMLPGLDRGRR